MRLLVVLAAALGCAMAADELSRAMYTHLNAVSCTRLLDSEGSIGCQTPRGGAVGVLYKINSTAEFNAFRSAPEDDYVALISQAQLIAGTNFEDLRGMKHCKGVLVFDGDFQTSSAGWSPDDKRPNNRSGLPLNSVDWNAVGTGLHWQDLSFPLFYLSASDFDTIHTCYLENNQIVGGKNPDFPLCGVELDGWMHAAKDAETCLRRSYCDALGSRTPYASLRQLNKSEEVVMLAAAADSLAMFHDLAFGSDAGMGGVVALLGAARLLGNDAASRSLKRNILFTFFQGEAFGYIGSSRIFFDMRKNTLVNASAPSVFPTKELGLTPGNIAYYIEAGQVMLDDAYSVFANSNNAKVVSAQTALAEAAAQEGADISFANQPGDLPPASLRSVLYEIKDQTQQNNFGGVVIADHGATSFRNTFYHSRFDNKNNTQATSAGTVARVCELAQVLARAAWALADDISASAVPLDTSGVCGYVEEMLNCIMVNASCQQIVNLTGALGTGPLNRYVGVFAAGAVEAGTNFLQLALADAVATNRSASNCNDDVPSVPKLAKYRLNNGRCINSYAYFYDAVSPAFNDDYTGLKATGSSPFLTGRDPRWSTWTESRWDSLGFRMFLVSDPTHDAATVGGGVVFLVLSFVVVGLLANFAHMPGTGGAPPAARTVQ